MTFCGSEFKPKDNQPESVSYSLKIGFKKFERMNMEHSSMDMKE